MRKDIQVFDYTGQICSAMQKGILLTTCADGEVNTMTIGWGMLGIEWNRPVFIAYVRESRYTKQLLEKNGEFTVNVPAGEIDSNIIKYCGTKSGRHTNKIQDLGLTLVPGEKVQVPAIRELPLTLECRVLYQQKQDVKSLPDPIIGRFYPDEENGIGRDGHIAYYGEIVSAYILQENAFV